MSQRQNRLFAIYAMVNFILLVTLVFTAYTSAATLIWSDDFNDGNFDGWTVTYGSYTATDNRLLAIEASSCINHQSTVNVGTWSFDLYISGLGSSGAHVCFSCEDFVIYPQTGYDLKVGRNAFELMLWVQYYDWLLGSYYPSTQIAGWQHVDITRDVNGLIRIFVNGTLQIEVEDNTAFTSNYFHFFCGPGEGLDNVLVSDSIDIVPETNTNPGVPTTPQIPGFPLAAIAFSVTITLALGILTRRRRR